MLNVKSISDIPIDILRDVVKKSNSVSDVLRYFGFSPYGGAHNTMTKRLKRENIDMTRIHANRYSHLRKHVKGTIPPIEELLVDDGRRCVRRLKERLIQEGIFEERCAKCGVGIAWMNSPLVLHLEHKNGKHSDNRLENLEILCPNCHSQTPTYGTRNKPKVYYLCETCGISVDKDAVRCNRCEGIHHRKVKVRPSIDTLLEDIKKYGYTELGKRYGVSGNAIRKWVGERRQYINKTYAGKLLK